MYSYTGQVGAMCILEIRNSSRNEICRHQMVWYVKGTKSSWDTTAIYEERKAGWF